VISHQKHYFVKYNAQKLKKKILEFLIDDIFDVVGGRVFQYSFGTPMGANSAPLLADLFSYQYEAEFVQDLLYEKKKINHSGLQFDISIYRQRFIYQFHAYVDSIYPYELEIKDTVQSVPRI
jgi:hypothetical protein